MFCPAWLGPLLLCFINDLTLHVTSKIWLLQMTVSFIDQICLQSDFNSLGKWAKDSTSSATLWKAHTVPWNFVNQKSWSSHTPYQQHLQTGQLHIRMHPKKSQTTLKKTAYMALVRSILVCLSSMGPSPYERYWPT